MEHVFSSPIQDVEIPEVPLYEYLFEKLNSHGDKVALVEGASERSYTYEQLYKLILRVCILDRWIY